MMWRSKESPTSTARDIKYAGEFGYVLKLLGVARNVNDKIEVSVSPVMIPEQHPLAKVNDSFNAVFVHGDAVDDAMFQGRGAGEFPTAKCCCWRCDRYCQKYAV